MDLAVKNFKNKSGINLLKELLTESGGIYVKSTRWSYSAETYKLIYDPLNDAFRLRGDCEPQDYLGSQEGYVQCTSTPNGFSFEWRVAVWNDETTEYEYAIIHTIIWSKVSEHKIDSCYLTEYVPNAFEKKFGFNAVKLREGKGIPQLNEWQQKFVNETKYIVQPGRNRWGYRNEDYKEIHPSKVMLILYPYLETMHKIGFRAASDFLFIDEKESFSRRYRYDDGGRTEVYSYSCEDAQRYGYRSSIKLANLQRIFRPGNTPKEILGVQDKRFVELLKNVNDHEKLVSYLTLIRNGEQYDNMVGIVDMNMNTFDLEKFAWVMGRTFNGERIFRTSQNLINYLRRIDMNEAISASDGLNILQDYLQMAIPLGIDPRIDSDSLKREHDVTARIYKAEKNGIVSGKISDRYEQLKKHAMKNDEYFIRPIKSHDDLIAEATMQHNCVASYAERIANGSTEIYVMRKVSNPDQSLITIEFCHGDVTQRYYSHNRRVTDPAHLTFIEKWKDKRIENMLKY